MVRAGVPIPKALRMLGKQTDNTYLSDTLADMAKGVESGEPLSKMFAKHSDSFSNLYASLTEVGEASGSLDKSLNYLGTLVARQHDLVRKTKGALTYPLVVVATLIVVAVLMFIFVLPKLTDVFSEFDVELPILTRILITLVNFASSNAILLILGMVALFAFIVWWLRSPPGSRFLDWVAINLPGIASVSRQINLARFTLTLSVLLASSMQIVGALKITAKSAGNSYYSEALALAADRVKVGVNLSDALESSPQLFPGLVTQMIRVGEEAGSVEEILKQLGNYYEQEVDQIMKNLSSVIEPVLVVLVGAIVGIMAVALIMPLYSITQAI